MPLHKSLSFWLEIICAILLALAIANPVGCWSAMREHQILIIDSSASMQVGEEWPSLQSQLLDDIRQSSTRDVYTIILAGSTPTITVGPAAQKSEVITAIQNLSPNDSLSDMDAALELASTITAGKVSVYTDHSRQDVADSISWHSVAQPTNNIGFIKATRDGTQIRVSIWNASDVPFIGQLKIDDQSEEPERKELKVAADEIIHLTLSNRSPLVRIQIDSENPDLFPMDDQVVLLPAENRPLNIAVEMNDRTAKMLGLKGEGSKQPPILRLTDGLRLRSSLEAHVLFTDRNMGGAPATWRLSIHESNLKTVTTQQGLFINHRHPILEDVHLNTVTWTYDGSTQLKGTPLIQHGKIILMSEEVQKKGERKIYHLNINPRTSTLHQDPSWPILLAELLEERRSLLPGLVKSNLSSHQNIQIFDASPGSWSMKTPSTATRLEHSGGVLNIPTKELGLHTVSLDEEVYQASVNLLSRTESDLRDRSPQEQKAAHSITESVQQSSSLLSLLVVCALLLLAWDWKVTENRP